MSTHHQALPWLKPNQKFPDPREAWGENSPAPGLLAAGGELNLETLRCAYSAGIFPWYSQGQPVLWWSPDPRMVLKVSDFKVSATFKKTLKSFSKAPDCAIQIDTVFRQVIQNCANSTRAGQAGTWILPEMIDAYCELHQAGIAHSIETWVGGQLVGGLYCIALGKSVFGESMFSQKTDASKIALAALVAFCRHHHIDQIDCQQNTGHLASLGAHEVSRNQFIHQMSRGLTAQAPVWQFDPQYWKSVLTTEKAPT
jgi:leucyl/phenylalanyl-tRNA---protein transferase